MAISMHFCRISQFSINNSQLTKNNNKDFGKENEIISFKMATLFHEPQTLKIWFERFEGYSLQIQCFQTWLLYNVEGPLMFMQIDLHFASEQGNWLNANCQIVNFISEERLCDKRPEKYRRNYQNNLHWSAFAKKE